MFFFLYSNTRRLMYVKKAVKGVTVRQQVQSHSLFRKSEKYQLNRPLWLSQYPPRKIWQWLKNMIVDDDDDNNNWERTDRKSVV